LQKQKIFSVQTNNNETPDILAPQLEAFINKKKYSSDKLPQAEKIKNKRRHYTKKEYKKTHISECQIQW